MQQNSVNTSADLVVPAAVKKARETGAKSIFGFGWNYITFMDNIPTEYSDLCPARILAPHDVPPYVAPSAGRILSIKLAV